jgi:uncharacterized protein
VRITWDTRKARTNRLKHRIAFEEVRQLFDDDVNYLVIYDTEHSNDEDRFIAIGPISRGVVTVVFVEEIENVIHILSARRATRQEKLLFQLHTRGTNR